MCSVFRRCFSTSKGRLDVVVIGGGIGGMSTAIAMRRAGHRVTILEASDSEELGCGGVGDGLNVSYCGLTNAFVIFCDFCLPTASPERYPLASSMGFEYFSAKGIWSVLHQNSV